MQWNKKRLGAMILGGLLLGYCLGYVMCRRRRYIVHTSACAGAQYSFHDVVAGDAKMTNTNEALAVLYTPLRYLETFYWQRRQPTGSACP